MSYRPRAATNGTDWSMTSRARGASWPASAFLFALPLLAGDIGGPPSAEAILDRYVAVTGGEAAYERIGNQITALTVTSGGQVVGHAVYTQTRSGDFHAIETVADRVTETGVSHGIAWTRAGESAKLLEAGEEHDRALRDAVLLWPGQWRKFYTDIAYETSATVGGELCDSVTAIPFAGSQERLWFSRRTGLLMKQEVYEPEGQAEFTFDDYMDVGGVRIARKQSARAGNTVFLLTLDSVEFNRTLPASTFRLPEEIVRLLKKKAAE